MCKASQSKRWDKTNTEKVKARRKKYRAERASIIKERARKYYVHNKATFVATARAREIAKLLRTPSWADKEAIEFFYTYCPKGCHVDHVIPLQGEFVSGLHIAENLQWIPAHANLSKGNKFTPIYKEST